VPTAQSAAKDGNQILWNFGKQMVESPSTRHLAAGQVPPPSVGSKRRRGAGGQAKAISTNQSESPDKSNPEEPKRGRVIAKKEGSWNKNPSQGEFDILI
jgi:hypothetical protein